MCNKSQFLKDVEYIYTEGNKLYSVIFNKIVSDDKRLTDNDFYYMMVLSEHQGITLSELSSIMKVSKPGVTQAMNKLIKLGYAEKVQSKTDKRFFKMYPSKTFISIDEQVEEKILGKFYNELDAEEKKSFSNMVSKLSLYMKNLKES